MMFVPNPVLQLSALLGACAFSAIISRRRQVLSDIGFYVPMFLMVAVTNPLFSHNGDPLFFLNGNPVTAEAFIYGAAIAVTVIGVMLWCKAFGAVMSSDKFLYLFGRAVPKLSLVLSMALRFVPRFKRQMKTVEQGSKAMGLYSSKAIPTKSKMPGAYSRLRYQD
ncbi:MAG: energy-coupling factor transporter transmembrane component T [Oscillospiraceae bacterium]